MIRLLLLLAMLLMPFGMASAPASTGARAAPMAMPMGHCDDQRSHHGAKGGITECTMACAAALPAVSPSTAARPMIICTPVLPAAAQRLHGMDPETATPPPKDS